MPTKDEVIEALKPIEDPELRLGILELGLIYQVDASDERVSIEMTLTSPACPYGPILRAQAHRALAKLPGVKEVQVNMTFTPPWDPHTMASEDAKAALGIWGPAPGSPSEGESSQPHDSSEGMSEG